MVPGKAGDGTMNAQNNESLPRLFLRSLPQIFRVSPRHFIIEYIFTFLDALMLVFTTLSLQDFFDRVTGLVGGNISLNSVLMSLALFALLKILDEAIDGVANFYGEFYAGKSGKKMMNLLNQKVDRLPAVQFENPDVLDQMNQAYRGAYDVRQLVHVFMDILCLYIPYFVFMGIYLYRIQSILLLILPLVFTPVLASHLLRSRYYTKLDDQTVTLRRKEEHYKECLTARPFFKETRALGASHFFLSRYTLTFKKIQQLRYQTDRKSQGVELVANTISLAGYIGILVLLISLLVQGRITVGAFSAVLTATLEMFNLMEEVFNSRLNELSATAGQIKKYFRFLDVPEQKYGSIHVEGKKALVLNHVSFTYPGASTPALVDVSFHQHPGETIAIVGENGSGKTTLSKLILGLYTPDEGQILLDGVSLADIVKDDLYKNFSCVFQNFQCYQLTLRHNVTISDFSNMHDSDDTQVWDALNAAGFHVNTEQMTQGLDTLISKEFAGTDLSRGEWQRLSIARAYYRPHQFIVLDEPTAAIDPFEEDRIYHDFMKLKKNHSAIIITHRLGAIKLADRVLLMKEGKLVGEGTHEILLLESPYYRTLWNAQSKYWQ
ncbi:MAG: ABC transporter ATP-binding protein/permease [Spirochaetaceae bacterium]|nr:ABC transporter ATP-binding protein/permease [Spirochaetaceae bacterium]